MTTREVGQKLVELCSQGQYMKPYESLYSPDIVSVESMPMPDGSLEMTGLEAVIAKGTWWEAEHEVHSANVEGPMVAGSHFCVRFTFDITAKSTGNRTTFDELAVYQVQDGKIVREQFFYSM